jgi:hypothetical protein
MGFTINPDIPLENIIAMYNAVLDQRIVLEGEDRK